MQNESSQATTKQYVLASLDVERTPAPSVIAMDEIKASQPLHQSFPPRSLAETTLTTAQWSVPSGNETYRMSMVAPSVGPPSTSLPSYKEAPSIAHTLDVGAR